MQNAVKISIDKTAHSTYASYDNEIHFNDRAKIAIQSIDLGFSYRIPIATMTFIHEKPLTPISAAPAQKGNKIPTVQLIN